jgi:hypothetical protein
MTVSPPHSLLVVPHCLAARLRYQAATVSVKMRNTEPNKACLAYAPALLSPWPNFYTTRDTTCGLEIMRQLRGHNCGDYGLRHSIRPQGEM